MLKCKFKIVNGSKLEGDFIMNKCEIKYLFIKKVATRIFKLHKNAVTKSQVTKTNYEFEEENLSKMYAMITEDDTKTAHAFEYHFPGINTESDVLAMVEKILNFQNISKIIIFADVQGDSITVETGKKIRSMIPIEKDKSPVLFSMKEKTNKKPGVFLYIMTLNTGF